MTYTTEEDTWLIKNIATYDYPTLTRLFNERFGRNLKSVSDHCIKTLHIHRPINKGDFRKGERRCVNTKPIGHEYWDGRYLWVKVGDDINDTSYKHSRSRHKDVNWVRKVDYVWRQHHGEIPKDHVIIFLNKDRCDCSIENLYCVPRKISLMLSKNRWHTADRELTLAAIKWCELYYAIKEKRKGENE